jgi:hypothetical protein
MDGIVGLLFGRDGGRLIDLVLDPTREERETAARTRRSGRWCGTTPGNAPGPRDLGGMPRPHRVVIREFYER